MSQTELDIGAILREHADEVFAAGPLSVEQRRALADLSACRTPALGGRLLACDHCGQQEYVYYSCRNRHCPKCQASQRANWLEREANNLLPVEYHHLVFTVPGQLVDLAVGQPRLMYSLLFEAASSAVTELAADPWHLGAQVGQVAVLHTWGQTLTLHPHVHILATGGGLSCNRQGQIDAQPCWRSCRRGFFLPVRALSRLFRGKYLAGLRRAYQQGTLRLSGALAEPGGFQQLSDEMYRHDWVVHSKPPCAGPEVVLKYLARYVYRVAISNSRLIRVGDDEVTFSYKDYRQSSKHKVMTLSAVQFSRRLLMHVLPTGFVRVRHYGLLANRCREHRLRQARHLLRLESAGQQGVGSVIPEPKQTEPTRCRHCGTGHMQVVALLAPQHGRNGEVQGVDSS